MRFSFAFFGDLSVMDLSPVEDLVQHSGYTRSVIFGSSTSWQVFPTLECRAFKTEREALIELFPFGAGNISSNHKEETWQPQECPNHPLKTQ